MTTFPGYTSPHTHEFGELEQLSGWQTQSVTFVSRSHTLIEGEAGGPMTYVPLPAPQSVTKPGGRCVDRISSFWFDLIHVFPRRIDLGNVLNTVEVESFVYNAFRTAKTWQDFINNVGAGLTVPDLPTLPASLDAQSGVAVTITVSVNGPPSIDETLDYEFLGLYTVSQPITGTRIVLLPFRPQRPIREYMVFFTNVYESVSGDEQRSSQRPTPGQEFVLDFLFEESRSRRRFDSLLFDWQARVFGVPVWYEPSILSSAASVNDLTINVDTTAYGDFRVGGLAIVWESSLKFDALQIESFTSTTITFTSGLTFAYSQGVEVFPVRTAIMDQTVQAPRTQKNSQRFTSTFTVTEPTPDLADISAWNTLEGLVYLDDPNVIDRVVSDQFTRRVYVVDHKLGAIEQYTPWTHNKRVSAKGFSTNSRQELYELRGLLHYLKGKRVPFFLPTFYEEVVVVEDLQNGTAVMVIENIGFSTYVGSTVRSPRDKLRLLLANGTILHRTVSAASAIDDDTEQITFTTNWTSDISASDIVRVDYVERSRFDEDRIEIVHANSIGEAEVRIPTRSLFS